MSCVELSAAADQPFTLLSGRRDGGLCATAVTTSGTRGVVYEVVRKRISFLLTCAVLALARGDRWLPEPRRETRCYEQ